MTHEQAFLNAIHANLADLGPWLMYADWLEERGEPTATLYRRRSGTNSLGMIFVTVPGGTFSMGGGGGALGTKRHSIQPFQVAAHQVTQAQWQAVTGDNPSYFSRRGGGSRRVAGVPEENLGAFPVENVSWSDAQEFVRRLNAREHEEEWVYRLAADAEWEYACRGAATSERGCSFHFYAGEPSNSLSAAQANFQGGYPDGTAAKGPWMERTTRVGSYPANCLGIYEMHGNLWEWCEDVWEMGPCRVLRGGSWSSPGRDCRASSRSGVEPALRDNDTGFRVVRVPSVRR